MLTRHPLLTLLYYVAIVAGLVLLYGQGEFSPSGFIYQEF